MILPPQAQAIWAAGKLWILLGAAAALMAIAFMGGLRWQKGAVESAKRARDNQANVAAQWKDRASGLQAAVDGFEASNAESTRRANEQRQQAERVLADLAKDKKVAEARAADWQRRYNEAKKNPDCAELMKATACPAFRSY